MSVSDVAGHAFIRFVLYNVDHGVQVHLSEGVQRLVRSAYLVRLNQVLVQAVEFWIVVVHVFAHAFAYGHVPRQQMLELLPVSFVCSCLGPSGRPMPDVFRRLVDSSILTECPPMARIEQSLRTTGLNRPHVALSIVRLAYSSCCLIRLMLVAVDARHL